MLGGTETHPLSTRSIKTHTFSRGIETHSHSHGIETHSCSLGVSKPTHTLTGIETHSHSRGIKTHSCSLGVSKPTHSLRASKPTRPLWVVGMHSHSQGMESHSRSLGVSKPTRPFGVFKPTRIYFLSWYRNSKLTHICFASTRGIKTHPDLSSRCSGYRNPLPFNLLKPIRTYFHVLSKPTHLSFEFSQSIHSKLGRYVPAAVIEFISCSLGYPFDFASTRVSKPIHFYLLPLGVSKPTRLYF
ncbi:hypothetical protein B0H10DRAFT_1293806 [Mycena sp. CBHHK59/15]|nr:hypothetical protein B0H10DRAFT_1293806 [Mycena sp. CBHHK59/15]